MAQLVRSKTPPGEADRWRTPQDVFDMLNERHGPFTLDAAADMSNHKCDLWLGPGGLREDALTCDWGRALTIETYMTIFHTPPPAAYRVFCNPPYSNGQVGEFLAKGIEEVEKGTIASATFLIPATTDVKWFHTLVYNSALGMFYPGIECEFSQGRIRFERPDGSKAGQPTHGSLFVTVSRDT